jgi:hypothetical protein
MIHDVTAQQSEGIGVIFGHTHFLIKIKFVSYFENSFVQVANISFYNKTTIKNFCRKLKNAREVPNLDYVNNVIKLTPPLQMNIYETWFFIVPNCGNKTLLQDIYMSA